MRVGFIGAGFIGRALARLAVANGYEVMLSNSRGPQTLLSTAVSIGAQVGTVEQAVGFADLIVLAITFGQYASLPPTLLDGKIVLDANNYYPPRDGSFPVLDN